ncbi:MAG TPA: gene transfer agent family protein [Bosea sp. (in: a-proteobacteria)]|uniref:gene transfer agent family protein n=1 Tax=Bosea sp. (in: a-proteobacteria) TaxID=1871050 RepID=UPI002E12DB54|nr:gene transfer agent family protein [Bosea sp. (in: a-proteobacteria)]
MKHVAFFGDGEKTFALTDPMAKELEQKAGIGIGALYQRLMSAHFYLADLTETIRLGLIGAGTSPADAQRLVETYATDRPVMEIVPLALDIVEARWSGTALADEGQDDAEQDTADV